MLPSVPPGATLAPAYDIPFGRIPPATEGLATLRASAVADPWQHGFFIIHRDVRVVIGSAGFKGPPDASGIVEIAYGIAPGFQGQGYATEAARALIEFAQRSPRV